MVRSTRILGVHNDNLTKESDVSNVIDFLERIGKDATLRDAAAVDLERVLSTAVLEPAARAALLTGDRRELEATLGLNGNVCCLVHAPDDDDDEPEEPEDEPDEDDAVRSLRGAMRRAVAGR